MNIISKILISIMAITSVIIAVNLFYTSDADAACRAIRRGTYGSGCHH